LDTLQEHHQQGPCLSAIRQHHTVVVDDYQAETRWPDFIAAALAQTSVRSSLSIQLFTDDSELGALNLYSEHAGNFTAHIEELALVIAAHAAVRLSGARRGRQFRTALATRDIIGQAKGIIMERYNTNAVYAFRLLVQLSQDRNESLAQIAEALVDKDHPPHRAPSASTQIDLQRGVAGGGAASLLSAEHRVDLTDRLAGVNTQPSLNRSPLSNWMPRSQTAETLSRSIASSEHQT
jgi:AmiR/NasT family two-component response regulator